jgi:hypothetical protein
MVYSEEAQSYYDKGWKDSPALCEGFMDNFVETAKAMGTTVDDPAFVQAIGETVAGVTKSTNYKLNFDIMTAKELSDYVNENSSKVTTYRMGKKKLLKMAKEITEDDAPVELPTKVIGGDIKDIPVEFLNE